MFILLVSFTERESDWFYTFYGIAAESLTYFYDIYNLLTTFVERFIAFIHGFILCIFSLIIIFPIYYFTVLYAKFQC